MSDTLTRTITDFIRENFVFDDSAIDLSASLVETGIIDSTGILEVVLFLEESFAITVDDDDVLPENFDSVERLAAYV